MINANSEGDSRVSAPLKFLSSRFLFQNMADARPSDAKFVVCGLFMLFPNFFLCYVKPAKTCIIFHFDNERNMGTGQTSGWVAGSLFFRKPLLRQSNKGCFLKRCPPSSPGGQRSARLNLTWKTVQREKGQFLCLWGLHRLNLP